MYWIENEPDRKCQSIYRKMQIEYVNRKRESALMDQTPEAMTGRMMISGRR